MANGNQRIVFFVPEDTTPAQTILNILKKNGVINDVDDIEDDEIPKLETVNNGAKDFFDKKITEAEMLALFQKELNITKENVMGIIKDIKEKLIPFGKKITIPSDKEGVKAPENLEAMPKIEMPMGVSSFAKASEDKEKAIEEQKIMQESPGLKKEAEIPTGTKSKIKKLPETKEGLRPNISQKKGPDTYREPIE